MDSDVSPKIVNVYSNEQTFSDRWAEMRLCQPLVLQLLVPMVLPILVQTMGEMGKQGKEECLSNHLQIFLPSLPDLMQFFVDWYLARNSMARK